MAGEQSHNNLDSAGSDRSDLEASTNPAAVASGLTIHGTATHTSTDGGYHASSDSVSAGAGATPVQSASTLANNAPNTAPTNARRTSSTVAGETSDRRVGRRVRSTSVMRLNMDSRVTQSQVRDAVSAAYLSGFLSDSDLRLESDSSDDEHGY